MKRFLLILVSITYSWVVNAQLFNHTIITNDLDTLRGINISSNGNQTNFLEVTYLDRNADINVLPSSQILSHNNYYNYFQSKPIHGKQDNHLVSLIINGDLKLYKGTINNRRQAFYLQVANSSDIYFLEDYQYTIDSLLGKVVPEYYDFRNDYHWRPILYSEKSLGKAVTAYNTLNTPLRGNGHYNLTTEIYMGFTAGTEINWFWWDGEKSIRDVSFPLGLFFILEYDRIFSINGIFSHNRLLFERDDEKINISRINFEPYLSFKYHYTPTFSVNPGFGAILSFNYNGAHSEPGYYIPTDVQKVTSGVRAGLDFQFKHRFMISTTYLHYAVPMEFGLFTDFDKERGHINSFRLSFSHFLW